MIRPFRPAAIAAALLLSGLSAVAVAPVEALVAGFTPTKDPVSPSGVRAAIDLPRQLHMRNTGGLGRGGPGTGAGLCVFTSVEVAARWQGVHELDGFQKWMTRKPGGGWPEKLDQMLAQFCREKGVAVPPYIQHTGGDPAFLDLAFKTRRCVAMTHTPAHMVNGMHLDQAVGAILDNNAPGEWEWAPRSRYLQVWKAGNYGWAVVFLAPPPPPGPDAVVPTPAPKPGPKSPDCPDGRCPLRPDPLDPFGPRSRPYPGPNCPRWERVELDTGEVLHKLHDNGRLIGVYDARGWHPATSAEGWQAEPQGEPPVAPPSVRGDENGGIVWSQIDATRPRYWISGREVSRAEAFAALDLTDDSDKYHLTVTGPADKAAIAQLPGVDKAHVQVYGPGDWPVLTGRVKAGTTLQAPAKLGGKVLSYSPGTAATDVAEALKFTDPNYRPAPPVAPAPTPKVDPAPAPAPQPAPAPAPSTPPAIPPAKDSPAPDQSATVPPAAAAGGPGGLVMFLLSLVLAVFRR